ncbi:MAG TPA: carboxypeptidase regulatory-like domain-containing protein [Candidatus Koribacter sp.]|jgi:hypothetical protein
MRSRGTAVLLYFFFFAFVATQGWSQAAAGELRGKVTDPSGAVVQNATVTATSANGKVAKATSNAQGIYELNGLAPGSYTVTVSAKGFTLDTEPAVTVTAGATQPFDIALQIAVEKEQVQVQSSNTQVDTSADNNASAIIIKGKDLEALSDDPDELQNELEALAGPSAGPNGGQMYIDGFTAGQLPPKASIREIRINQNPFSAEYDKLGYGRIEIFTKPGTDEFHGQAFVIGNDNVFNTTNPFAGANIPPYHSEQFSGNLSGPIFKNKASFFINAERRNINDEQVIVAQSFDPSTFSASRLAEAVNTPRSRTNISPRVDFQISPNNSLTARYQYWLDNESNEGVSGFSLPQLGYADRDAEHTFQVGDTQIYGPSVVNETRFQYVRELEQQTPYNAIPQINVQGAFGTGGNATGFSNDHQDRYELQNYTSVVHGKHMFKFGARLRATRDANWTNGNFNGVYTYSSLYSYALTQYYLNQGVTVGQMQSNPTAYCTLPSSSNIAPVPGQCAGIEQYSQTVGTPAITASYVDAGLYFQDEYKMLPNLTLSYGLRFETQNEIQDHGDWAPRVGVAWGIGKKGSTPKTVLRAGYGFFYDRFPIGDILNSERFNGTTQQEYVVQQPCFYDPTAAVSVQQLTACGTGTTASRNSIYQVSPQLRAPLIMQGAASLERQLWKNATGALTYINSRGVHQLVTINGNAPLPGTYDPTDPGSAIYPDGYAAGNIFQYYTEGVFKQNQLIANVNWRASSKFTVIANYSLSYADSDVPGKAGFPTNSYDIMQDYGPAAFNIRNRGMLLGSFSLPWAFRISPFILMHSGTSYNFVSGVDTNGDSILNDRPYYCTTPGVNGCTATVLGNFSPTLLPGGRLVPINTGVGPGVFSFNMRFGKTFGLGPKLEKTASGGPPQGGGGGGHGPHGGNPFGGGMGGHGMFGDSSGRKYSLTFNAMVRNLFNNVNEAPPNAILTSPYFGQVTALAGGPFGAGAYNRRIDMQVVFQF